MTTRVYNAKEVTLAFCGRIIDSGFDDGEFCKITPNADIFGDKAGTDGEVTRFETNDRRATIEIKIMQTALSNAFMSQLLAIKGVGVFTLRDRNGFSLSECEKAWISKLPEQSWAREPNARVWTLRTDIMNVFIGGNNELAQNLIG